MDGLLINELGNLWTNERMDEWTKEGAKEGKKKKGMNECMNTRIDEWTDLTIHVHTCILCEIGHKWSFVAGISYDSSVSHMV